MNTNPRTIKALSPNDECLVLRFKSSAQRDEAWAMLWCVYENEPIHYEMRKSKNVGEVNYGRRGIAPGECVIVKAPTLCSDTWHSVEFKELSSYEGLYDIDRVQYYEIVGVSYEDDKGARADSILKG